MACMFLPHGLSVPRPANLSAFPSSPSPSSFLNPLSYALPLPRARRCLAARSAAPVSCALRAVVFDCDGVILESEHLHRQAYNEAFAHFGVRCSDQPLNWELEFYDEPQNQIGGGKPKMRWYFKEHGWPSSSIFEKPPESDEDRAKLIDTLQMGPSEMVCLVHEAYGTSIFGNNRQLFCAEIKL